MAAQIFGSAATVLDLNIALFGLVPSNAVFNNQLGVVGANNANLVAYANQITNANFAGATNASLATTVLTNLLGTDPSNTADLNAAVTALLAANPANRGVVVYQLATILSQKEGDVTFGAAASKFNTAVLNGYNYSNDPTSTVSSPANPVPVPVVGKTFVLTASVDAPTGTSADDIFVGTEATLGSGDTLAGGGGSDTLKFASSGAVAVNKAGFSTTGIATALVTSDAVGGTTFDVTGMVGTTSLVNDNSSTDVIFNGAANVMATKLQNVSGGNTQFIYQSGAVAGTNDSMSIALSNNKTIAGGSIGTVTANGIENLVVTTSGGASVLAELGSAGFLKTMTISGDQNLTLGAANFFNTAAVNTVDASKLTGALNMNLTNDGATSISVAVTGGSGNDRVSFTTFDKGDAFTGGTGTDTIALTNAVATGTPAGTLSGVETLEDTTIASGTVNMSNFAGVTNVFLSAGLGGATTVSNATTGITETVNVGTLAAQDLTTTLKTDGTADAITLQLNTIGKASTLANVVATGFETVNLNTVVDSSLNGSGALTIANLSDTTATTLNINSGVALTVTAAATGALTKVDGSASAGGLTLNSLTYSTAGATIIGGKGADKFTPGNGADTITLGTGADVLTYTTTTQSNDKMDIVTDFTSGSDVLNLAGLGVIGSTQYLGARSSFGLAQGALTAGGTTSAVLDSSTNILWVDANGDGTLDNRDFRIQLNGVTSLTAADLNLSASGSGITVTGTNAAVSKTLATNATGSTTDLGDTVSSKISFLATATVDGAAGTDTLVVTDAGAVTVTANFTNFEGVTLATVGTTANSLAALPGATFKTITGSANADTIATTAGLVAGYTVSLGDGADVVTAVAAASAGSTIDGGAGDDTVTSTIGAAFTTMTLTGGAGNDTLNLAAGDDISAATVSGWETINLAGAATMTLAQYAAATTVAATAVAANNLTFSNAGAFTTTAIAANVGVETYTLANGVNTITTGGAADATRTITGNAGIDTLNTTVANGFNTLFTAAGGVDVLNITGGLTAAVSVTTAGAGAAAIGVTGLETLTVAGTSTANALTLVSATAGDFATIDLSGITGGGVSLVTTGLTAATARTLTLTAGNDTITNLNKAAAAMTIDFGTGNATVTDLAAYSTTGALTLKAGPTATGTTIINVQATTADFGTNQNGAGAGGTILDFTNDVTVLQLSRTIGSAGPNSAGQLFIQQGPTAADTAIYFDVNGDGNFGVGDIQIVIIGQTVAQFANASIANGNVVL